MPLRDSVYPAVTKEVRRYSHVVLTRFNMRVFRHHRAMASYDEFRHWVDHRTSLFKDFCLPSLVNQESRPYRWYLGVDGRHPELTEPLAELCAPYPWIELVHQEEQEEERQTFQRALRSLDSTDIEYIITTRIDCDDSFAKSYTSEAESYTNAILSRHPDADDFWISFPFGAQRFSGEYRIFVEPRNHFLTRVVSVKKFFPDCPNALNGNHAKIFDGTNRVFTPLTSGPMWLEVVHDMNIANKKHHRFLALGPDTDLAHLFSLSSERIEGGP